MKPVLHIVPHAPPEVCGIGDYAWRVGIAMLQLDGIPYRLLQTTPKNAAPSQSDSENAAFCLAERDATSLRQAILGSKGDYSAVILHVSLYGYQKRGVPFLLSRTMTDLSKLPSRPALICMFHELYASGPFTTSAFWLQPLQKLALIQLAKAADSIHTNRHNYAVWLNRVTRQSKQAVVMPVFSNLGEPVEPTMLTERPAEMIMFASGMHGDTGGGLQTALSHCRNLRLDTLHVMGGGCPEDINMSGVRVIRHGFLSEHAASALLSRCRVAYTSYHPDYLGKSGIFAACAAHAIAVIVCSLHDRLPDGLQHDQQIFREQAILSLAPKMQHLQDVANNLRSWYLPHSIMRHAESYCRDLYAMSGDHVHLSH